MTRVVLARRARGELLELNWPLIDAIQDALGLLERDPAAGHALRGRLRGLHSLRVGTYRIMLHDRQHVTYNAAPGKHGRIHHQKYAARGEKMPVVLVVGGDPLTFLLGGTEVPDGISEFDVALGRTTGGAD